MSTPLESPRYWSFISYAHADKSHADWLHHALESYRIPRRLVGEVVAGRKVPGRIVPVFLDRADLAASGDLEAHITAALRYSQSLIVICSPAAARSERVQREIELFNSMGKSDRVLALIVAGRPNASDRGLNPEEECFPLPLRRAADFAGSGREYLAADIRDGKPARRDATLKLVAGILGIQLDALRRRDLQRQQRRWIVVTAATLAGMALATGTAVFAWRERGAALRAETRAQTEARTAQQVTDFLIRTFDLVGAKDRDGSRVLASELLDRGAQELRSGPIDEPMLRSRMLEAVGRVYRQLGLNKQARPLLEEALELRRSLRDADPVELGSSLAQSAALAVAEDQFDEAERHAREALAALDLSTDSRAPMLRAELLLAMGDGYITQADFPKADAAIAEALAISESSVGKDSPAAADARLRAARSYREQGDFTRAEQELRTALGILRSAYSGPHQDIARAQRELAIVYQEQGDFVTYDRLAKEAYATALELFGPEDAQIAPYLQVVATSAFTSERLDEAVSLTRQVLRIREESLGPNHVRTGYDHYNLGFMLGRGAHYPEAMSHLLEAQRIWEAALGPEHPDVAYALDARARYLREQGQLREAEPLILRSLAINEKANGPDHPTTARSVLALANWMRDSGRIDECLPLYDRAERIRTNAFGPDSAYVKEVRDERAAIAARTSQTR